MVMRIVFLGTPEFAVPAFQRLLDKSHEIVGVFTQPDRPVGRGHKLQSTPVKSVAQTHGIPVYQPEKIRLEENRSLFEKLRPDFIGVVAYGQILPLWLLQAARFAPINIHASLLPRYRGAAPIAWAIINGETVTGVTTMIMREKLDSGPVLLRQEVPIAPDKTAGELSEELAILGADLLIRTIDSWNTLAPMEQDESMVSWAPRITKSISRISWNNPADNIQNLIRGLNPWPGAYSEFRGAQLHIWRSQLQTENSSLKGVPGTILGISGDAVRVLCGKETVLDLLQVQLPGKSRVTGREFVNGARLHSGEVLI